MSKETALLSAVDDPTLSQFDLSERAVVYPLGFPLEICTNSKKVLLAVSEGFGAFEQEFFTRALKISLGVSDDGAEELPGAPVFRSRDHLLSIISDAQNFVVTDHISGFAFGWVSDAVVRNRSFFRYHFLDAAVLNLITQRYLAPVHGALLETHGTGVLLCGESGAGKSTLAFACARQGWRYITDDACSLVRNRGDRFGIGNPHSIRFREDVASHFPELASRIPGMRVSRKIGIEIFTGEMPDMQISTGCRIDHVVFLNRAAPGRPALQRFSKLEALDRFAHCVSTGNEQVRMEQLQTYERLLGAEFWELRYRDLDDAVAILDALALQNANQF